MGASQKRENCSGVLFMLGGVGCGKEDKKANRGRPRANFRGTGEEVRGERRWKVGQRTGAGGENGITWRIRKNKVGMSITVKNCAIPIPQRVVLQGRTVGHKNFGRGWGS